MLCLISCFVYEQKTFWICTNRHGIPTKWMMQVAKLKIKSVQLHEQKDSIADSSRVNFQVNQVQTALLQPTVPTTRGQTAHFVGQTNVHYNVHYTTISGVCPPVGGAPRIKVENHWTISWTFRTTAAFITLSISCQKLQKESVCLSYCLNQWHFCHWFKWQVFIFSIASFIGLISLEKHVAQWHMQLKYNHSACLWSQSQD